MIRAPSVVFLDRDGTIIHDASYMSRPEDVVLLPGAANAIARLNEHHIPVIVVTNQSGIARGMFTVEQYYSTQRRLDELLARHGARIDATYFCPDHPDFSQTSGCRKPSPLLFERAAAEHSLDMTAPAFIGDRWRDIAMFHSLGGTPFLIVGPATPSDDRTRAESEHVRVVESLADGVDVLIGAPPK